jgi:hypothetical protein
MLSKKKEYTENSIISQKSTLQSVSKMKMNCCVRVPGAPLPPHPFADGTTHSELEVTENWSVKMLMLSKRDQLDAVETTRGDFVRFV